MASLVDQHHDEGTVEVSKNYMASPITQQHDEGAEVELESVENYAYSSFIDIPNQFILPEKHRAHAVVNGTDNEIPVIDMAGLSDPTQCKDTMNDIHKACVEWGIFQAINHGVPHEVMKRMKECVVEFLSLPISERAPHGVKKGPVGQGYRSGFVKPDIGVMDWRDFFILRTYPDSDRDYQTWPNNPNFRVAINEYSKEIKTLSSRVLACLSNSLGLSSPTSLEEALGEFHQVFLINNYPPCPQPEFTMGVNEHTDISAMTYLWEPEDIVGLQVLKDGEWIQVNPLPEALLISVGDQMEIVSNGIYKTVNHRAIVNSTKRRISVVSLHDVHPEAIMTPMPDLVTPNYPSLYHPTRFLDHARKFDIKINKIGYNSRYGK